MWHQKKTELVYCRFLLIFYSITCLWKCLCTFPMRSSDCINLAIEVYLFIRYFTFHLISRVYNLYLKKCCLKGSRLDFFYAILHIYFLRCFYPWVLNQDTGSSFTGSSLGRVVAVSLLLLGVLYAKLFSCSRCLCMCGVCLQLFLLKMMVQERL